MKAQLLCPKRSSLRNDRSISLNIFDHVLFLRENMTIAVYKVKKESMFNLWWHTLLNMSEIRSKEYFRWIHCVKLVNKVKRSRMKVSQQKDYVSKTHLSIIILHVMGAVPQIRIDVIGYLTAYFLINRVKSKLKGFSDCFHSHNLK